MININEILDRIRYYEKRHSNIEADCRNLERRYDQNDNTAQGFLVAIRKQEHWNGANFESIAKELLRINPSKVCKYILMRSIDCPTQIMEQEFNSEAYSENELESIAQKANSNIMLRKIFSYVKAKIGNVQGYVILCKMAKNPITEGNLLSDLYEYEPRVKYQILMNFGCEASTELLMEIFSHVNCYEKPLCTCYLLQFQRTEINEKLVKLEQSTPDILAEILTYSYRNDNILSEELLNLAEEKMLKMDDYSDVPVFELMDIAMYGHNTRLREKCWEYSQKTPRITSIGE